MKSQETRIEALEARIGRPGVKAALKAVYAAIDAQVSGDAERGAVSLATPALQVVLGDNLASAKEGAAVRVYALDRMGQAIDQEDSSELRRAAETWFDTIEATTGHPAFPSTFAQR